MITHEAAEIANSLWTATAGPAPECPPLAGPSETEVAIVGGGFTGLSAALHLAEAGMAVTLLEAQAPGWGASGRNGGQVNPGLKEDPDAIEARFGDATGGRMVRLSGGAADLVFDLIRRHGIDCAARQPGWLQPVHSPRALALVEGRVHQWQRRGAPVRMVPRDETAAMLGTSAYLGAMLDERGGSLHPLDYAFGLARAAQGRGAVLHGGSAVTRIEPVGAGWRLTTALGRLEARRVILCTNGYSEGLVPELARSVVPVRSVQVATAPLPEAIRRSILPGGHAASDSRRLLLYYRLDPAGRFIIGGRGAYGRAATLGQMTILRRAAVKLYPVLVGIEWIHAWGGMIAVTADHYPHLNIVAPGMMAALGYNGRGVAMATALGRVAADWACGTPPEGLDFPVTELRPIPLHALRKPAVSLAVGWNQICDRLGL